MSVYYEPAFPTVPENHGYRNSDGTGAQSGMTLRDYFAAAAVPSLIAAWVKGEVTRGEVAINSYAIADALLAERNKQEDVK